MATGTSFSNYLENEILDHILRGAGGAWTAPTTLYLALHTADPTDAGSGAEVSGGSYARQAITFGAASGGSAASSNAPSFTGMPAATVTHIGIWDASSGGNLLFYGALSSSRTTQSGDTVNFASGAVTVALD